MQRCNAEHLVFKLSLNHRNLWNIRDPTVCKLIELTACPSAVCYSKVSSRIHDPTVCKLSELTARPSAGSYSKVSCHVSHLACSGREILLHRKLSPPQHPQADHAWGIDDHHDCVCVCCGYLILLWMVTNCVGSKVRDNVSGLDEGNTFTIQMPLDDVKCDGRRGHRNMSGLRVSSTKFTKIMWWMLQLARTPLIIGNSYTHNSMSMPYAKR